MRTEYLDRQLVLASRWGKRGLPYPLPQPCKINLYFGVVFCRLFSLKNFVPVTVKNRVRVTVSCRVRDRVRVRVRVRLRNR